MEPNDKTYTSEILSEKELRRYALQISSPQMGLPGQEKLKLARVLVVGAGGKGTCVLQNLATIGVGKLGISDNYPVQESELSRQYLYGNSDLGKQKAIISKQKLQGINHLVEYELHNVCLNEKNIRQICKGYDVIVDATDNFHARYLINDAAIALNLPLVFCQTLNGEGLVSVFNYQGGPSLRCLYPEPVKDSGSEKNFVCQVTLMTMLGGVVANEVIKIILNMESALNGNLMTIDSSTYSANFRIIKKNPANFTPTGG